MKKGPKCLASPPLPTFSNFISDSWPTYSGLGPGTSFTLPECAMNFHFMYFGLDTPGQICSHFSEIQANLLNKASSPWLFMERFLPLLCTTRCVRISVTVLSTFSEIFSECLSYQFLYSTLYLHWPTLDLAHSKCSINAWLIGERRYYTALPLNIWSFWRILDSLASSQFPLSWLIFHILILNCIIACRPEGIHCMPK